MKTLLVVVIFVMLVGFSCSSITDPLEPEPLSDGIAIVKAEILDADYPSWSVTIKILEILNKGKGCPVWENDEITLDNSPYDYITGQTYKLTIQYIPTHSGGVWVVKKDL